MDTMGEQKMRDNSKHGNRIELHSCAKNGEWFDTYRDVESVKMAYELDQAAIAIVDHCSVRNYPAAARTSERLKWKNRESRRGIKLIWGVEVEFYSNKDAGYDHIVGINRNYTTYSAVLLAKNRTGLKNINRIMSHYLIAQDNDCTITRSTIEFFREGLLVGASAEAGEITIGIASGKTRRQLKRIASFYDFLEMKSCFDEPELSAKGHADIRSKLIKNNRNIMKIGDAVMIPVVAVAPISSDYGSHHDVIKTTDEMLREFSYLGDRALDVVVTNPNTISDQIEEISPFPEGRFYPALEGAEKKIEDMCYEEAKDLYGDNLPRAVRERLERELEIINGGGEASVYLVNREIVDAACKEGNPVAYRGMIGSSLVAFLIGLTQVNPLAPHYVCPECKNYYEADGTEPWITCEDSPDRLCPDCNKLMHKYGFNIPWETMFGISGDRFSDIDIVVPSVFQNQERAVVRELLKGCQPIRAGKVVANSNDISDNTDGYKTVMDEYGLFVIPLYNDIEDFTPFQYGYFEDGKRTTITHQDWRSLDCSLLKIDVIGDVSLQILKDLTERTSIDADDIPLNNDVVTAVFSSHEALGIYNDNYILSGGTYGIPDFDNDKFKDIAECLKPSSISELIKCYGLSWGAEIWNDKVCSLVSEGKADIGSIISSREDIYTNLCNKGLSADDAYRIMELARKNREISETQINDMKRVKVPDWWIDTMQDGKFFSIRANDVIKTITGIKLAWFKLNYANDYYSVYLANNDYYKSHCRDLSKLDMNALEKRIRDIRKDGSYSADHDVNDELKVYQVLYEMTARGLKT